MNARSWPDKSGFYRQMCHLNLHKTFSIPHGERTGCWPILTNDILAEFAFSYFRENRWISWDYSCVCSAVRKRSYSGYFHAYIMMMGADGLTEATKYAILNANYIASSLKGWYKTLYTGTSGFVAHEMILDCRNFKAEAGITEADIAKRLMDYGSMHPLFHFRFMEHLWLSRRNQSH